MANSLKSLDAPQVLRSVYDPDSNRLRVDNGTQPGGSQELIVSHTDDSIRIGDGSRLTTATQKDAKVGLDVFILNSLSSQAKVPTVANIPVNANLESSYVFPTGTNKVLLKSRNNSTIKFSFTQGESNTNYITIPKGSTFSLNDVGFDAPTPVYFQTTKNDEVVEILHWEE